MEHWSIRKPAIETAGGIIVSQHAIAAQTGARVLEEGGNAIDAAIAAGFALGVVEPWMSGIGGCGFMTVFLAETQQCHAVEFGVRSSAAVAVEDYPLAHGFDSDLFAWPGVLDHRNVLGPYSVAVPGYVAGVALALEKFGTWDWHALVRPAIDLAEAGFSADWYSSLKIASSANDLKRFESSASVYLPNGDVPMGQWASAPPTVRIKGLAETLRKLASEGPDAFYRGTLAKDFLSDCAAVGIKILPEDLETYRARDFQIRGFSYRDAVVFTPAGLCGGPTLERALSSLASYPREACSVPDGAYYCALGACLDHAYSHRLRHLGHSPDGSASASTTHLNVTDRHGNVVSLTQTLLSIFGSKLMLPETGILMNNGMMWFDPEPGKPNSLLAGKEPLSNMCPVIVRMPSGEICALGASGGRRIVSSVMQLISFLVDQGMSIEAAMHQPRIDVSGSGQLLADSALDSSVKEELQKSFSDVSTAQHGVFPSLFSCPSIASFDPHSRRSIGSAFVTSPLAAAVPEQPHAVVR